MSTKTFLSGTRKNKDAIVSAHALASWIHKLAILFQIKPRSKKDGLLKCDLSAGSRQVTVGLSDEKI